ncbi:MAG TPA: hypothetical protein VLJ86_11600 [Ramlibacter sp.]|nr:hypothetical protein [Ramlibacter sp.]
MPRASFIADDLGLGWANTPGAQAWRVRVFRPQAEGADGVNLLYEELVVEAFYPWPVALPTVEAPDVLMQPGDVITVQASCAGVAGRAAAFRIPT